MTAAYMLGISHKKIGYSIYYNPFVHVGSAQDYNDWENGWKETI